MGKPRTTETLQRELAGICDAQPFTVRFKARNLRDGTEIERGANEETPSGSTRKISIMMAALKAAEDGRLDLEERIPYEARLAHEVASGMIRFMTPGLVLTLRDAITGMIVLSDNVCTKMVLERLTLEEVDGYGRALGLAQTHHRFLIPPLALPADHAIGSVTTTSAADQVELLQILLDAQDKPEAQARLGCSERSCRWAMQTLKNQVLRYGIRSRLPFETVTATKSGRGKRGRMDAGIVFRDGAPFFIIGVFTDDVPQEMADGTPGYTASLETIGRIARACWDHFPLQDQRNGS